jgi:class 3 adenylate cyclase
MARDLVGAYLDTASAAVIDMGGHVAKKLGDGLMALFGYAAAQENDAERATRVALAIQRGPDELNRSNTAVGKPAARIGLDAGPVVVDAAGEIFGDTPNVAARVPWNMRSHHATISLAPLERQQVQQMVGDFTGAPASNIYRTETIFSQRDA